MLLVRRVGDRFRTRYLVRRRSLWRLAGQMFSLAYIVKHFFSQPAVRMVNESLVSPHFLTFPLENQNPLLHSTALRVVRTDAHNLDK